MLEGGPYNSFSADLWAVGVSLWAFCFGSLPFYDTNTMELFDRISEGDLEFPRGANPNPNPNPI
ncbi:unnamed protein product [Discosporangium mesarthrocarpum]